jgi:lantibiotic biosynthesis protein
MSLIRYFDENSIDKLERINKMLEIKEFRTAIKTASPKLYIACNNLYKKDNKDINNIYFSLLNYFIRMFSRPTPFSTFSSVGIGQFNEKSPTTLSITPKKVQYKIRISHEWIYKLVSLIENDLLKKLSLKKNNMLIKISDKLHLSYFTEGASKENGIIEDVSLTDNQFLSYLLSKFENGTKVSEFLDVFQKESSSKVSEEKLLHYISHLMKKDFLISELRFSNSIEDPLDFLLNNLKELGQTGNYYYSKLERISEELEMLSKEEINEDKLDELERNLKLLVEAKDYIHIDSFYSEEIKLNSSIEKDIQDLSDTIIRFSNITNKKMDHLDYYLNKFTDYYGIYNAISVKDLLEDKSELGPPPTYANPLGLLDYDYHNQKKNEKDSFLKGLLYKALINGKSEIDISNYLKESLKNLNDISSTSMDLYFSIYAESKEHYKNGDYLIYPSGNVASSFAGRTFGRFLDLFPDVQDDIQQEIFDNENKLQKKETLMNLSIQPLKGKASNVMNVSNKYECELSISTSTNQSKQPIEAADIYIYSDGEKFHLFSKSRDGLIFPTKSHMVNYQFGMPNIYRFLLEISDYKRGPVTPFNWGEYEEFPYLPRVRSGKVILQEQMWNISIKKERHLDQSKLRNFINEFFKNYDVTRYIKIIDFDNYILIDTHSSTMMELFSSQLKKKESLQFVAADELFKESIISDRKNNFFVNEFICSSFYESKVKTNDLKPTITFYSKNDRYKDLGDEWIYLKLYHPRNYENKILKKLKHKSQEIHIPFYFIRYADPYPHIRLRVRVTEDEIITSLEKLKSFTESLRKDKLITNSTYEVYNREIERYGGRILIRDAEEIFCKNSEFVLGLLDLIKSENKNLEYVAVYTLSNLLKSFLDEEYSYIWLKDVMIEDKKHYKEYRKLFKDNREEFHEIVDGIETLFQNQKNNLISSIKKYLIKYYEIHSDKAYLNHIVLSFLHMHLNRLGIHSEKEQQVMNFLYFIEKEKYLRNKNKVDNYAAKI